MGSIVHHTADPLIAPLVAKGENDHVIGASSKVGGDCDVRQRWSRRFLGSGSSSCIFSSSTSCCTVHSFQITTTSPTLTDEMISLEACDIPSRGTVDATGPLTQDVLFYEERAKAKTSRECDSPFFLSSPHFLLPTLVSFPPLLALQALASLPPRNSHE